MTLALAVVVIGVVAYYAPTWLAVLAGFVAVLVAEAIGRTKGEGR